MVLDAPWEGNNSNYVTVFRDGSVYRMYYRGRQMDLSGDKLTFVHGQVYCYAESTDGIHWKKPNLGLFEFQGSKKNNIIWNREGSHNFAPFKDANPDAAPESRYKALGGVKSEGGLYAFQSSDGIRWSKIQEQPVVTDGYFDSQNLAFWDAERREYREYHREFREGRDIMTSTSSDFLDWSEPAFPQILARPAHPTLYEPGHPLPSRAAPAARFPDPLHRGPRPADAVQRKARAGQQTLWRRLHRRRVHGEPRPGNIQGVG